MTLNWRHKVGLFVTLVAVGIGLFLELSVKQAVGIALLGIAFSWLIGSVSSRTLMVTSILICAVGLYVAATPVWSDWNSYKKSAAEYDRAMADLQSAVKSSRPLQTVPIPPGATIGEPAPKSRGSSYPPIKGGSDSKIDFSAGLVPARTVKITDSVQSWERLEKDPAASDWTIVEQGFPASMSDAEIMKDFQTKLLLPRPTFALGSSLRAHAWNVFGGLALFVFGLSGLSWLLRRIHIGRQLATTGSNDSL